MSRPTRRAVFLQRRGYRQRRLRDVARMVPVAGAVLWLLPIGWSDTPEGGISNAAAVIYIFAVWVGLLIPTAVIARFVQTDPATERD